MLVLCLSAVDHTSFRHRIVLDASCATVRSEEWRERNLARLRSGLLNPTRTGSYNVFSVDITMKYDRRVSQRLCKD